MTLAGNKSERKAFLFELARDYKTLISQVKTIKKTTEPMREEILAMMRELDVKKIDDGHLSINVAYRDKFDAECFVNEHPEHESLVTKAIKTEYKIDKKDLNKLEDKHPELFKKYNERHEYLTVK